MAYRSSAQVATASGTSTSLTVNAPAGLAQNDIVTLFWVNGGTDTSTITWPAGFTQFTPDASTSAPDTKTIRAAWKRAGASEPSTYQVSTDIGGGDKCILIAVAHSGRHLTNPPVAVATTQLVAQTDPVSINATGFTASAGDDAIWFAAQSGGVGEAVFLWTYSAPASYTERQEAAADAYTSGVVATRDNLSAGATGTITGTMTSGDADTSGYGAFVIQLPAAAGGTAYTLTAEQGSYSLTGQNAGLIKGFRITANQGSYTLLGQDAYVAIEMNADQGSYSLTGQDANVVKSGPSLSAESGSYTLTGFDTLRRLSMLAASGSYALTGQNANLVPSRRLTAEYGSYSLNGRNATLLDNGVPDAGDTRRILMGRHFYGWRLNR